MSFPSPPPPPPSPLPAAHLNELQYAAVMPTARSYVNFFSTCTYCISAITMTVTDYHISLSPQLLLLSPAHCCSAGYNPPRLSPARSSSPLSTASDEFDPDPAQQQSFPPRAGSPADADGNDSNPQQANPQQPRTVSGSFSSLSVEKGVSSGSVGLADGLHHHHLQVLAKASCPFSADCVENRCSRSD